MPAEFGDRALEAQRVAAVGPEEAVAFRADRTAGGTAQLPVGHHQIDTRVRKVQIPHSARPVHVQPAAILPAHRTEGPRTFDGCQGDHRFHVRCQLDHLLIDRDHSCKREVRRYAEGGYRVLRLERGWSLDTPILLDRRAGVHSSSTYLQPNRRRTTFSYIHAAKRFRPPNPWRTSNVLSHHSPCWLARKSGMFAVTLRRLNERAWHYGITRRQRSKSYHFGASQWVNLLISAIRH
jgi:hypothetical protein